MEVDCPALLAAGSAVALVRLAVVTVTGAALVVIAVFLRWELAGVSQPAGDRRPRPGRLAGAGREQQDEGGQQQHPDAQTVVQYSASRISAFHYMLTEWLVRRWPHPVLTAGWSESHCCNYTVERRAVIGCRAR